MTAVTAVAGALTLRVTVGDTWAPQVLEARSEESVAAVKARALGASHVAPAHAAEYEVKHFGVLVREESLSLAAAGIGEGAALVVLARRRRPVR